MNTNYSIRLKKKFKKSSTRWLMRQLNDPYVIAAKKYGYKSRSSFKLLEIDSHFSLLKKSHCILDLGCAPGGWIQVIRQKNKTARLIGIDLCPIHCANVHFIQGDFTDDFIINQIKDIPFDLILSDMASNLTGDKTIDRIRMESLVELISNFAINQLINNGNFICKTFSSGAPAQVISILKKNFLRVRHFKPKASRKESEEIYLVALNKK